MIRLALTPQPGHPWLVQCTPSAYDEAVRVQFGGMPGLAWRKAEGYYVGPAEAFEPVIDILKAARVVMSSELAPNTWPVYLPTGEVDGLRYYQAEGAAWCATMLRATGGALLADEMGIGKTAQAITAARRVVPSGTVLVVCPAIVKPHWLKQIVKWASPGGDTLTWVVCSYEVFTRSHKKGQLPKADLVIFDEAHYLSNPTTKRSQAAAGYRAAHAPMILLLSGTPMTTEPADLWHPLDLLHPGRWGSRFSFQKRYCGGHFEEIPGLDKAKWVAVGATHIDELAIRLRAVMLRRTKADVALELPARVRQVVEVELPPKAKKALKAATLALDWAGAPKQGVGALLSQVEGYKVTAAIDLARECIAAGGRPLILTTRKATAEQIADELRCPCAHGDTPPSERRSVLLSGSGAACSTIYAVTTGIDLVEFDSIIFTGLDWVPSTLLQAEARIHRIGQLRGVTVYYLVGLGSIDEVVRERVIDRLGVIATLAGGDESMMATELGGNDEDILGDLVQQLLMKEAA